MKDPHEAVKEALSQVADSSDETRLAGLNIIAKCLDESPEVSRNLATLGAVEPLFACLESENPDVVLLALDCFHFALPNNNAIQNSVHEQNGLTKFCLCLQVNSAKANLATTAQADREKWKQCQVRCMGCLSALIRNNPKCTETFVRRGGLRWVTYALKSVYWKLHQKVFTLATYLLSHAKIPKDTVRPTVSCFLMSLQLGEWVAAVSAIVKTNLYEEIGQQHGELMAQFLQALVPAVLKKDKTLLDPLLPLIRDRANRLQTLTEKNREQNDILDDYSIEVELLNEVLSEVDAI